MAKATGVTTHPGTRDSGERKDYGRSGAAAVPANKPPSRFSSAPVMYPASSEASITARAATSSGRPKRRIGVSLTNSAIRCSRSGPDPSIGSHIGVRMAAGCMELQRITNGVLAAQEDPVEIGLVDQPPVFQGCVLGIVGDLASLEAGDARVVHYDVEPLVGFENCSDDGSPIALSAHVKAMLPGLGA